MLQRANVAVIGAGSSGLLTARTMRDAGHRVVVFESRPDVGGVWSATRDYPGLSSQNNKGAYSISDLRMPKEWPDQPNGAQMREYLNRYADEHALRPLIRFGQQVLEVRRAASGWTVLVANADGREEHSFDAVVVASGPLNDPYVPEWAGRDAFEQAGGQVLLPEQVDLNALKGRRIAVIGWGKTACDLAVAVAPFAATTTIIARTLRWKTPQPEPLRLHELVALTRAGDWLLYPQRSNLPRAVTRTTRRVADVVRKVLMKIISRQLRLHDLGMVPPGDLYESSSQVTAGMYEAIHAGDIVVRHGVEIESLRGGDIPAVELASGEAVPADVVVLGTGYRQRMDYLDAATLSNLVDANGRLALDRAVHSDAAPGLYFVGWTGSISAFTTSEASALWATAHLAGWPSVVGAPRAKRAAAPGGTLKGVSLTMLYDIDDQMADMGSPLPRRIQLKQWLKTIDAQDYEPYFNDIRRRLSVSAAAHGGAESDTTAIRRRSA